MAAGTYNNPGEYIEHHLTFFAKPVGEGGFWTLNVDSLATSIILGVIGRGSIWWVVRGATSGVPNRRQAFVELLIEFGDDQAKGIFYQGQRSKLIAPLPLTGFVGAALM